ncbi:MAG: hypothetical protein HGA79_04875 [Anaerolineales bacterium]|nr:hypothetical protein [Anaerolineales bacterium]
MGASGSAANEQWIAAWLDAVVDGSNTMSQRLLSSIEKHDGLGAGLVAALEKNIHLLLVEDGAGREIVAASRKPFKVIC